MANRPLGEQTSIELVETWESACENRGTPHRWASATPRGWVCMDCEAFSGVRPSVDDYRTAYLAACSSPEQGVETVSVPPEAARRSKAENLLLGLHKIVDDLAPYFDKPLTEESMPHWLALDSAQKAVAQYFAATRGVPEQQGTCDDEEQSAAVQPKCSCRERAVAVMDAERAWMNPPDDVNKNEYVYSASDVRELFDEILDAIDKGRRGRFPGLRSAFPISPLPIDGKAGDEEAWHKVLRDTETYKAMLAQDRYPANFGEQAKGVEGVVLPLGSTEAVTRLLRDLVAWGFGMGQAQPESSELLSWHERADATTAKLREHFAASQGEAEQGREGVRGEDITCIRGYAEEIRTTLAGGGRLFAPRNAGLFADALDRVLDAQSVTPPQMDFPAIAEAYIDEEHGPASPSASAVRGFAEYLVSWVQENARENEAGEKGCLVCGKVRPLAVWHELSGVGVCRRCRDARHVIEQSATATTPKTGTELLAAVDRVMQHYLGEDAPLYGDARYLADYALSLAKGKEREKIVFPHPESRCDDCGGKNLGWHTDSATWNRVCRPEGERQRDPMLCPRCFCLRAEAAGICAHWVLMMQLPISGGGPSAGCSAGQVRPSNQQGEPQ